MVDSSQYALYLGFNENCNMKERATGYETDLQKDASAACGGFWPVQKFGSEEICEICVEMKPNVLGNFLIDGNYGKQQK